jgi:hypothetical protein
VDRLSIWDGVFLDRRVDIFVRKRGGLRDFGNIPRPG